MVCHHQTDTHQRKQISRHVKTLQDKNLTADSATLIYFLQLLNNDNFCETSSSESESEK